MSRLSPRERKKALDRCFAEQKRCYEAAGKEWPGPVCAVRQAQDLGDEQYLEQRTTEGDLWAVGPCSPQHVLHHLDNNPENNPKDGSNHDPLCRRHNVMCDPPHVRTKRHHFPSVQNSNSLPDNNSEQYIESERVRVGERGRGNIRKPLPDFDSAGEPPKVTSMEMLKNVLIMPRFISSVKKIMRKHDHADWNELVEAAVMDSRLTREDGTEISITINKGSEWLKPLCARLSVKAPFYWERVDGNKTVYWKTREKKQAPAEGTVVQVSGEKGTVAVKIPVELLNPVTLNTGKDKL